MGFALRLGFALFSSAKGRTKGAQPILFSLSAARRSLASHPAAEPIPCHYQLLKPGSRSRPGELQFSSPLITEILHLSVDPTPGRSTYSWKVIFVQLKVKG
jgi:hypothetical protein